MLQDKSVLQFNISKVINLVILITALLFILSVAISFYYYTFGELAFINTLFSLDHEGNIPTRFASGLLVAASFLFYIIYRVKRKMKDKFINHWLLLASIFLMMGLDESARLHEQTSEIVKIYVTGLHFAWVIPGSIFVLLFIIFFFKFFMNLDLRWKKLFFLAAALYVGGALGMELVGNFYRGSYGQENLGYVLLANFEEILEFSGTIVLLYTQMSYLMSLSPCYQVNIKK